MQASAAKAARVGAELAATKTQLAAAQERSLQLEGEATLRASRLQELEAELGGRQQQVGVIVGWGL